MLSAHHPHPLPRPRFDVPHHAHAVPRSADLFLHQINRLVDAAARVSPVSDLTVEDDVPVSPSGPNYHYAAEPASSYPSSYPPYPHRDSPFRIASPPEIDASPLPHSLASLGPLSAPHSTDRFPVSSFPAGSRQDPLSDRTPRYGTLPRISTSNVLEHQRRLSEPALPYMAQPAPASGAQNRAHQYSFPTYDATSPHSPESPFLPRVASLGALRHDYQPHPDWKQEPDEHRHHADPALGDVSPFQPSFSGSLASSPPLQYAVRSEDNTYGPSPPGTGTSSSSTTPAALPAQRSGKDSPDSSNKKTYSFVALPGNAVRKRPRRRYDEIDRLYQCSWPECNKAYGTLNHLNAHVQMQKHGPKRSPNEFKELRKQWRKAKKEYESPGLGPIRRSMSLRGEHQDLYPGHPYHRSFSHNSALSPQLAVAIPHLRQDGSYLVDHLRYPDSRTQVDPHGYSGVDYRQQQQQQQGAWPASSSREMYQSPLSTQSGYPAYLDSQTAQMLESPSAIAYHSPARSDRLPPNSMLLTPLMPSGSGDSYTDPYYDDKPRGGDQGSGDEY
ncbi:Zn finger family DNA binding protein [Mycena belliarum]|uniref:Zn finger family DNA binding protein n=1 Tax=Mycena belliarum TaxID=1033014 RepID=A0AAD6U6I1_9AGAR|nr:Zn finger family DNA binding protein [Mycena belliae]